MVIIKKILTGVLLFLGLLGGFFWYHQSTLGVTVVPGTKGGMWFVYDKFEGFQTKYDASKISDGANPNGQNTTIFDGDRIAIRPLGYDLMPSDGTASTTASPITSLHTFRTRSGENILMRSVDRVMEYYESANSTWETLRTGYSTGYKFGFADYNINTDVTSYIYFGNSQEQMDRWTGVHTLLNGTITAGATTITVDSVAGFTTTTNSIILCGVTATYTTTTPTGFIGVSGAPDCVDNSGVAEAPDTVTGTPRGNILLAFDNRLWIGGITTTPQAVYFSKYGDATLFSNATLVSDGTDTSPGIFNLGEGGGGIVGMALDESSIYLFKKSAVRKATLSDTTYTLGNLKPFDGKSQTTGATNALSTFTSGNEVIFITPDKQIMMLSRLQNVDYPQVTPISDAIAPTIKSAVFTSSTGITFQDKLYIAARSSSDVVYNDSVFVFNLKTKVWDSPIVGWNVSDFAIYDDGTGDALYFSDAITANVYKVNTIPVDYTYSITANWRSKQFNFGAINTQKQIDNVYIEGYISDNTTLSISLLLDENGFTQTYTTNLLGTETGYIYSAPSYNLFGFHPFGTERFGSNDDLSGRKKFRVYLNKSVIPTPFYNAQIEFASDGDGADWEVDSFGFNVRPFTQAEKPSLYRIFK